MSKTISGGISMGVASITGGKYAYPEGIAEGVDGAINLTSNLVMGDASSDTITVNAGTTTYVNDETMNFKNGSTAGLTIKASSGATFMTLDTHSTGTLNLYNDVVFNGGLTTQSIVQMNGTEIVMNEQMVVYTKANTTNSFKISTTETNGNMVSAHDMLIIHTTQGAEKIFLPMAGELLNVAMDSQIGDMSYANKMDIYGKVAVKNTTDSTSSITGGIIIDGGVGIAKKFYVGTDLNVTGNGVITGTTTVNSTTDSTSSTTGGVIIAGGVGIAKKLYVGTDLNVTGNSVITGTTTVNSTTDSTSYSTGSVIISGGVGISKHMYLQGGLYLPTSGGTPSNFNYYEEALSLSTTFQSSGGGGTSTTITQYLTRIGNMCFIFCPTIRINANGYNITSSITIIPSRFRPTSEQTNNIQTVNIGAMLDTGGMVIKTDGGMRLYKSNSNPSFSVGDNSGTTEGQTFFWMIQ